MDSRRKYHICYVFEEFWGRLQLGVEQEKQASIQKTFQVDCDQKHQSVQEPSPEDVKILWESLESHHKIPDLKATWVPRGWTAFSLLPPFPVSSGTCQDGRSGRKLRQNGALRALLEICKFRAIPSYKPSCKARRNKIIGKYGENLIILML